jgi:hypothetical protein
VAKTAGNLVSYKKDAAKEINIFMASSLNSLHPTFTQTQNSGTMSQILFSKTLLQNYSSSLIRHVFVHYE